jgi:hypothetical protein
MSSGAVRDLSSSKFEQEQTEEASDGSPGGIISRGRRLAKEPNVSNDQRANESRMDDQGAC